MPPKASDGIVHARTVLECVLQLQRQGTQPAMQQLEATEPELAEYLFETLSSLHQSLLGLHGSAAKTRRVYREMEVMALVCIQALRQSHHELWQSQFDSVGDGAGPAPPKPPPHQA